MLHSLLLISADLGISSKCTLYCEYEIVINLNFAYQIWKGRKLYIHILTLISVALDGSEAQKNQSEVSLHCWFFQINSSYGFIKFLWYEPLQM